MRISLSAGLLVVILINVVASTARSQWEVTNLHPAGALQSFGYGVSGTDQVGYIDVGGKVWNNIEVYHAASWTGSAASFVDMNPASAVISFMLGTDGVHQVGSYTPPQTFPPAHAYAPTYAGLWSGTPASMISLQPSGGSYEPWSHASAVEGALQVGSYNSSSEPFTSKAARWNGSAASYTGLAAPGYYDSGGAGTDGSSIVGSVSTTPSFGPSHAALWKFGPDVFVDLNPSSSTASSANDVEGNLQVGFANFGGGAGHAVLWSGTAASAVDVNPAGASSSVLYGADAGFQVGSAAFSGGTNNAGIWSGTSNSFVNLHSLLPSATYSSSEARSVWTDTNTLKVVGTAYNSVLSRNEAVLWTLKLRDPPPGVSIPTVLVGNPGNPGDKRHTGGDPFHLRNGVGAVDHEYRMATTEVTNAQYVAFLNSVAKSSDPYGLYNGLMLSEPQGGIERTGSAPNFTYQVKHAGLGGTYTYDDKPVVYVSAGDAMRFANWLHNGQPTGAEGASTTEGGAYTLNGATGHWELAAATRNSDAQWFLPSEDEWYKAAYHRNDGAPGSYSDYPTASFDEPNNNLPASDTGNSANFGRDANDDFALTDAGAYLASRSSYGTQGQGGNVEEWNETLFPEPSDVFLGVRGGNWYSDASALHAAGFTYLEATEESNALGFRVASVLLPVPATGDFNRDGNVDVADYTWWQKNNGSQQAYNMWRTHFGNHPGGAGAALATAVPEPHISAWLSILLACAMFVRLPRFVHG